jgi:hypothetical protein
MIGGHAKQGFASRGRKSFRRSGTRTPRGDVGGIGVMRQTSTT